MADSLIPGTLRGKLLLADPRLRGSIFHHSVILIHDHESPHGATGLILNQPTHKTVGDFLTTAEFEALRSIPVHVGGPVDGHQLTFCCFWWNPKRGLRWALRLTPDQAAEHARRPGRILRAFVGYSGWSAGQLENELRQGSWFSVDPRDNLLGLSHEPELWRQLLGEISPHHQLLAMAPENFFLN